MKGIKPHAELVGARGQYSRHKWFQVSDLNIPYGHDCFRPLVIRVYEKDFQLYISILQY